MCGPQRRKNTKIFFFSGVWKLWNALEQKLMYILSSEELFDEILGSGKTKEKRGKLLQYLRLDSHK